MVLSCCLACHLGVERFCISPAVVLIQVTKRTPPILISTPWLARGRSPVPVMLTNLSFEMRGAGKIPGLAATVGVH